MKKLISLIAVVCMTVSVFSSCSQNKSNNNTLSNPVAGTTINIFNWGQYISDGEDGYIDVISEFESATGIKVNYSTFESNESMYSKIKAGGVSYDIIIPSDYMVERMIKEGMLMKLNFDNIPNFKNVSDNFKNPHYDPENLYSVPYTWGTVGLIYNKKYVKNVDSWAALWDEKYKDKILMFSNSRDAFAIGASLLGYDPNTESKKELEKISYKLKEQKKVLQDYVMDQIFDLMIDETAWIAPYYAGDYLFMKDDNENLEFVFPKEGFNLYSDVMCVPTCSQNKAGAEAFINFICDYNISTENCDYLGYSSPMKDEYLPEEILNDIAYPDQKTLEKSFKFINLSTDTLNYIEMLWLSVRSS